MKNNNISIKKYKKTNKINKINKIKKQHKKTYKNKQLKLNGGSNSSVPAELALAEPVLAELALVELASVSVSVSKSVSKSAKSYKKKDNIEYIDFITKYSDNIRIKLTNNDAITDILCRHFEGINNLICLDFHKVVDLYKYPDRISPDFVPKCVISYIGGKPETIIDTTTIIKQRILSDEVILGIIVYNKDKAPNPGTKGWIISKIIDVNINININMIIHFIDDTWDHICCVNEIKKAYKDKKDIKINTHHIIDNDINNPDPKKYIREILEKIDSDIKLKQKSANKRLDS